MTKQLTFVGTCLAMLCVVAFRTNAADSGSADTFSRVTPSLAIIETSKSRGSALCIYSTDTASYYLTAAHVVGTESNVTVYRRFPKYQTLVGNVVALGSDLEPDDLAVVRVSQGHIPVMRLFGADLKAGMAIAVVGYPSSQYNLLQVPGGELTASIHLGTISAIVNRGGIVEYDAMTEHGNSGGPVIDPATGDVYGIVRAKLKDSNEGNLAIGITRVVIPFLTKNNIRYVSASKSGASIGDVPAIQEPDVVHVLPGANKVAIFYFDSGNDNSTSQELAANAQDFSSKFARQFGVDIVGVSRLASLEPSSVANAAREAGALIGVGYSNQWRVTADRSNAYGTSKKWTFSASMGIDDSYGVRWFGAKKEKDALSGRDDFSAVTSSIADLNDQIISSVHDNPVVRDRSSTFTNLFRYALPMSTGERRIFVGFATDPEGAKVSSLPAFSPAADAGLQIGDTVTSINNTPLAGKTDIESGAILRLAGETAGGNI